MTSQLASQLQRLQQRPSSNKHLSVSFLFEKNDARSFTREQIHQLATAGLQTLVVMDNRFHAFIEPLFSSQKTRLERARLTAPENKEIDRLLDHLLTLLSPHLFLTAAQQVFEYLVRVYEVHVYNVMAVLRAFLPYHDHNLFARALLMLDLRDTGFQFLVTNQERGAPLLREHLILAAAESRKALRLVCLTMAFSVRYKVQNNAANALFAGVAVGLSTHAEADAIWRVLVPFVVECLSGEVNGAELGEADAGLHLDDDELDQNGAQAGSTRRRGGTEPENREAVCTALVVLASWCCEVQFSAPMMSALMKPLLRFLEAGTSSRPVVLLGDLLQLLDLLFTTQQSVVQSLSFESHVSALMEMPWGQWMPLLTETLAVPEDWSSPRDGHAMPLRTLVTVLVQYALGRVAVAQSLDVVPRAVLSFLQLAAEVLPLSHALVKTYVQQLMAYDAKHGAAEDEEATAPSRSSTSSPFLDRVTLALEGRYQRAFDESLSELLQTRPSATAATSTTAMTAGASSGEAQVTAAALEAKKAASDAALRFLSRHLGGARYQVLTVQTRPNSSERLPLFACLLHPLAAVRQVALAALRETPLHALCCAARQGTAASALRNENENADEEEDNEASGPAPRRAYQADAKGSLLELLAHMAEFEADALTAQHVVEVCAGVLTQLRAGLTAPSSSSSPTKSAKKSAKAPRTAAGEMPDAGFCANACRLLLRALHHLAVLHPTTDDNDAADTVRSLYLETVLHPLLVHLEGPRLDATAALVRSCAVYHTAQLYLLAAQGPSLSSSSSTHSKTLTAKAAALLQKVYPALAPSAHVFDVETPSAVVPVESRPSGAAARRRQAAASDSSDDEKDDDGRPSSAAPAPSSAPSARAGPVLALWTCSALLLDAWAEAEYQLPRLRTRLAQLADARAAAPSATDGALLPPQTEATEATELALCLATAAQLAAEPRVGATGLAQFLIGQAAPAPTDAEAETAAEEDGAVGALRRRGYLGLCLAAQRDAARQALTGEARTAAGRGVANSALVADFVPADRLTRRLAAVAQAAAKLWLSAARAPVATVKTLLQVVGLLGGALPPLADSPDLMAPVLFELVSPSSAPGSAAAYPVDWFYLVYDALARRTTATATTTAVRPTSRAALALVLLLPLWAPPAQRVALLQGLQSALLASHGASGARKAGEDFSAGLLLHAAMQDKSLGLSLTTVSAVIESMAREESRFQLTSGAADLISQLLSEPVQVVQTPEEREPVSAAAGGYVVPCALAADVIAYFFAPIESTDRKMTSASAPGQKGAMTARVNLTALLPRLLSLLATSTRGEAAAPTGKRAKHTRGATPADMTTSAARFLEAICQRVELVPCATPTSTSASPAQDAAATLCAALLRAPWQTVRDPSGAVRTRPVYRLALTMLARAMQRGQLGEEAAGAAQAGPLIFTRKAKAPATSATAGAASSTAAEEAYLAALASTLRPLVLGAVSTVGHDVAVFCTGTVGGFHRFFLPFLHDLTEAAAREGTDAAALAGGEDALEVLLALTCAIAPAAATRRGHEEAAADPTARALPPLEDAHWQPSARCVLRNPLTFAHATRILDVVSASLCVPATVTRKMSKKAAAAAAAATSVVEWQKSETSLRCLDLLSALLQASPAIAFDDDDDDDEASLFALVQAVLDRFPVSAMCALLMPESESATLTTVEGSHRLVTPYVQRVLQLLRDLTYLCAHQSSALSEHNPQNTSKVRTTLIKQSLLVMATLLSSSTEVEETAAEADDLSRARIDVITELLRALAPLFSLRVFAARGATPASGESGAVGGMNAYLHIPLAALLIRLEPVEKTEALRYKSAVEVCQEVLGSFDIHTQIMCLAQLMRLVMNPAAQLAPETVNEEAQDGEDAEARAATDETVHLFRRMVKPNQIVNRQEAILALINLTVKADTFLSPFIELQHQSNRAGAKSRAGRKDGAEAEAEDADDTEASTRKAEEGTHTSEECMQLLVSSLEVFSHYSDLNAQTVNHAEPNSPVHDHQAVSVDGAAYSEEKAYVMLLELLAGNALACVLAGINEPTFVSCLQRLLVDHRTTLQLKGLEVLLDRLHHSLPTTENTLTDEELEQHRRELRDPRKRLTLADLIRVKARPLTTKRSFSLYPLVETVLRAAVRSLSNTMRGGVVVAAAASSSATTTATTTEVSAPLATTMVQLALPLAALDVMFRLAQLAVACLEELVRIVGSGGSTQAEKTLLNASRTKRVTEAVLSKLFGNKARVQEVHHTLQAACAEWLPLLTLCTQRLFHAPSTPAATDDGQSRTTVRRAANAPSFNAAPSPAEIAASAPTFAAPMPAYMRLAEEGLLGVLTVLMTMLASTVQVMGVAFTAPHCADVLQTIVAASVFQVVELPALVAQSAMGALLRRTTLSAFIRCYPACWQFSQPALPRILFAATHLINVNDAETNYLTTELLTVLEALLEPQVFMEACAACVRGTVYVNVAVLADAKKQSAALAAMADTTALTSSSGRRPVPQLRLQVATHSFHVFFQCVQRRVQNLRKEELVHMTMLTEGNTPRDNFWLSALEALAVASTMPAAEVLRPVFDAFSSFFVKFKPKHCTRFLRVIAEWAFADSTKRHTAKSSQAKASTTRAASDDDDHSDGDNASAAQKLSRTAVHRWLVFYALANHLLEKLGAIMDFGFPVLIPYVTSTLHTYCSAGTHPAKQHASLLALTLEGALECVRRMARAQTPGPDYDYSIPLEVFFATPEVFNGLMPALVHQLANLALLQDDAHSYSFRAEHAVIPAVRAFFACLQTGKLQSKTQAELARGLRHPSRLVRCQTLLCLDGIYADGGEELASRLMAEVLPAVVELTEDRDDDVVEAARTMCTNLSNITGQDVLHAMS